MPFESSPIPCQSRRLPALLVVLGGLFVFSGCSTVKRAAASSVADVLAQGGTTFSSDEDPELVKQAIPFSLKLMESVLAENPKHARLLEATAAGFTKYAYAFVLEEADEAESKDFVAAEQQRQRARRLFLRAKEYAFRGLEVSHSGFAERLAKEPKAAAKELGKEELGLAYWAAASLGAAISVSKDDPALIAELPQVEALIDRVLEVDESWGEGAAHAFLITYEASRQGLPGSAAERSRSHYLRAVELSKGKLAGPHVSYAEAVCVEKQDLADFERVLGYALAVDAQAPSEMRLANLVMQRRARWLLGRKADLFFQAGK